jgi:hypothetical protein
MMRIAFSAFSSLLSIPVCAGTNINFKSSPSSANRLSIFAIVGFRPGYTLSKAVIMTVLKCMLFDCSVAFKIANISALKIVVWSSTRNFNFNAA